MHDVDKVLNKIPSRRNKHKPQISCVVCEDVYEYAYLTKESDSNEN